MLPTFAPTFCSFSAALSLPSVTLSYFREIFLFLLNQQNLYKIHYIRKLQSQHSVRLWSLVRRKRFPTLRSCFKKRYFT